MRNPIRLRHSFFGAFGFRGLFGLMLVVPALLVPALPGSASGSDSVGAPPADPAREVASALDLVPEQALAAIGWSGSTVLAAPFRATALGGFAAEPRIAELCAALIPALETQVRAKVEDPEEREALNFLREALRELWAHPLAISLLGIELHDGEPIPQLAATLGEGVGAERLLGAIEAIREREGAPAEEWAGAATGRRVSIPGSPLAIIYGLERGRLFFALGESAATATASRIRGDGRSLAESAAFRRAWEPAVGRAAPMDWLFLDTPALRGRILAILSSAGAVLPPLVSAALADDGLGRLGPILFTAGIEGDGFRRSLSVAWRSSADPGEPIDEETLALVPRDTGFFSYEDQDLAGCIAALKSFAEGADAEMGRQLRGFQALADGFLGFRLQEDLLASIGRRFLVFEEPSASGLLPGLCLVMRPSDPAAVESCVKRLVASAGALAGMKGVTVVARERGGISFIETSGAPVPIAPAWALRGERLFVALHPTLLEEVFHRLDAPDARERSILADEDFRRVRARIGRDQHGIFYTDTASAVREFYPYLLPLLQAGIAALGGEVSGLSAMQIPPPHLIGDRLFGDIHGYRRTADGWLWEAHGPLPFCLPDLGGATVALLAAGAISGIAEERAQTALLEEVEAVEIISPPPPPRPAPAAPAAANLELALAELLALVESRAAGGHYPNDAASLLPHLAADSPARALLRGGAPGIVFPAEPIAAPAAPGTLLFHTDAPGPRGERRLGVAGGEIRSAGDEELETAKRLSGWARSARL